MNHLVGQRQIGVGVQVDAVLIEIRSVGVEADSETVVLIEHAGHAVEAKAIHAELIEPVAAVGKEEMEHLAQAIMTLAARG